MKRDAIRARGVRVNNLRGIDVCIPRGELVVITGLSGSGKSSLAFDTLYAEGQRRYVESLSAYARQFLGRMNKPECDYIKGLPPAIAIEQKVSTRNPRSTVGTSTEVYEYLRLLFARVGRTFSPVSGTEVRRHTADDVVECALQYQPGTRLTVLAPLCVPQGRSLPEHLAVLMGQGLSRLDVDGEIVRMEDYLARLAQPAAAPAEKLYLLLDRLTVPSDRQGRSRLTDSVETAFLEGGGECALRIWPSRTLHHFSCRFEADGMRFEQPTDHTFSFNSPLGACPKCEGFGRVIGIDEHLVVPNTSLSVRDGAVVCWRGEKMGQWREEFIRLAPRCGFPVLTPYYQLTQEQRDQLWHGCPELRVPDWDEPLCIDAFFHMLEQGQYKIQNRVMLARYRGRTTCPVCHGSRLRPEALYVRVGGRNIAQLVQMPVGELAEFFRTLQLTDHERQVARRLLEEIGGRLQFLCDVGLDYLTLDRLSSSLSGGESQRINLATSLGSSLVGSLYILDEPSIGLHSRDTQRLIAVLRRLRDLGNTVVVVEHDEEIIRAADRIIDIGPEAGRLGGEIVWQGRDHDGTIETLAPEPPKSGAADNTPEEAGASTPAAAPGAPAEEAGTPPDPLPSSPPSSLPSATSVRLAPPPTRSHTYNYLTGLEQIAVPRSRRQWNRCIEVRGARANNLRGINVRFPLNVLTVVTGVSGSGKSTLVRDILYRAMKRNLDEVCERPGEYQSLEGDLGAVQAVEFVDQNPIGRSSRSNPVTYVKAYDEIRRLMAEQPLAVQLDMTPAHFSFNAEGGRCEECKGEGVVHVEMQFMADLELECEACHGQRFKPDVLEVRFRGQNIHDLLEMTVNQAMEFFTEAGQTRVVRRLRPLQDVGLGYIKLGQSSATLSGGENQRVKLAYFLSQERAVPTLFIFDEPTTGLHLHDIRRLLRSLGALIDRGHTVVIIEHNLDVVKCADHVIDLGPEGGRQGGRIVFEGTPEALVASGEGYTARCLRGKM